MILRLSEVFDPINNVDTRKKALTTFGLTCREALAKTELEIAHSLDASFPDKVARYLNELQLQNHVRRRNSLTQRIADIKTEVGLVRPLTTSERMYRSELATDFQDQVKESSGELSDYRFHGAPIIPSLGIIAGRAILSSEERGLERSSHDVSGQISISDVDSLPVTLADYTGLKDGLLPMGCIFIIRPDNNGNVGSMTMPSIPSSESGQIRGILTSLESIPVIQEQCRVNGWKIPVTDFLSFDRKFVSSL